MKKNLRPLSSDYANDIQRYLDQQRCLGRNYRVETCILKALDAYLVDTGYTGKMTQQIVIDFIYSKPDLTASQYQHRYSIIRLFTEYLASMYPDTPYLNPRAVSGSTRNYQAHIYRDDEIEALLVATSQLPPRGSLRPDTYRTLIGLLASTGMRISEAIRLDIDDVDLVKGILQIRESKFRKSRLVPVHDTTRCALIAYREACNKAFPKIASTAFFISQRRKRLYYGTVVWSFLTCARLAGVRMPTGKGPRLHDFRHTFAVRRVLEWYRAGVDVQAMLPSLATYLGHAHFEDTTYYLTAGAEILTVAAQRFEQYQAGGAE